MFSLQSVAVVYCLIGFVSMLFLYPYIVDTYTSTIEDHMYVDKPNTYKLVSYFIVPLVFILIWPIMLAYILALRV